MVKFDRKKLEKCNNLVLKFHVLLAFFELVQNKYYDMVAVRDVNIGGFARFGVACDPDIRAQWSDSYILDDSTLSQISFELVMIYFSRKNKQNTCSTDDFIVMPNISQENLDHLGRKNPVKMKINM